MLGRPIGIILCAITIACGPTIPKEPYEMPFEEFEEFYRQFDARANFWFCGVRRPGKQCDAMPDIPTAEEAYPTFKWIERAPKSVWGGTCTCQHSSVSSTVTVPSDEWKGGCTPHEIGHGVLKRLKHECWKGYEHPPNLYSAPERCK